MSLHWRILKKNALHTANIHCRITSSSLGSVRHGANSFETRRKKSSQMPSSTLPDMSLEALVAGGYRIRQKLIRAPIKHEWPRKQVRHMRTELNHAVLPFNFQDTSVLDLSQSLKTDKAELMVSTCQESKESESSCDKEFELFVARNTVDDLLHHLLETKYVQRYTYNSDDIIVDWKNPEVEVHSSKQTLDGAQLDKHFGVTDGFDLHVTLNCDTDKTPKTFIEEDIVHDTVETECEVQMCATKNEQTEKSKYSLHDIFESGSKQSNIQNDIFDRYDNQESDFPAFHFDAVVPQFTSATELNVSPQPLPEFSPVSRGLSGPLSLSGGPMSLGHVLLMCSSADNAPLPPEDSQDKPNLDQLMRVQDHLNESIPIILHKAKVDWRVYRLDLILENNFRFGKHYVTKGLAPFAIEVLKFRLWAHCKHANVAISALRAHVSEAEGAVRVHVAFRGLPQLEVYKFWNFMPWKFRKSLNQKSIRREAIVTHYVDGSGLIYKIKIDRTMEDREPEIYKSRFRKRLEALLTPKPAALGGAAWQK